ncbi:MAG: hypothetical protein HYX94_09565 [Chloroflexi bacterium]|nr:hypothetical protein [Chloroflexota bacterium]
MEERNEYQTGWQIEDFRWRAVGLAWLVAVAITVIVGIPLLLIAGNAWLLAAAGSVGLLGGGFTLGREVGPKRAILSGALMAAIYFLAVALAFFAGWFLELLPEPMPGLPQGDSTFYFAWPLAQFVVGILGAALGSRFPIREVARVD